MYTLLPFLLILFNVSQYQCEILPCKTNCTVAGECWHEALAYRSSELIEQLFSFSSLSIHIDTYQRHHTNEINDSILFLDNALENYILNEAIDNNLTMNLFRDTKTQFIDLCKNLISTSIETVNDLPPLICALSTCSSNTMNFMVLFIISILITSFVFLICTINSFQTYRQAKFSRKIMLQPTSFKNSNFSLNSNRF